MICDINEKKNHEIHVFNYVLDLGFRPLATFRQI